MWHHNTFSIRFAGDRCLEPTLRKSRSGAPNACAGARFATYQSRSYARALGTVSRDYKTDSGKITRKIKSPNQMKPSAVLYVLWLWTCLQTVSKDAMKGRAPRSPRILPVILGKVFLRWVFTKADLVFFIYRLVWYTLKNVKHLPNTCLVFNNVFCFVEAYVFFAYCIY